MQDRRVKKGPQTKFRTLQHLEVREGGNSAKTDKRRKWRQQERALEPENSWHADEPRETTENWLLDLPERSLMILTRVVSMELGGEYLVKRIRNGHYLEQPC